jgi:hypothetical protein
VVVQPGLFDVAGELIRVQPNVAYDSSRNLICVFYGCATGRPLFALAGDRGEQIIRGQPAAVVSPCCHACSLAALPPNVARRGGAEPTLAAPSTACGSLESEGVLRALALLLQISQQPG